MKGFLPQLKIFLDPPQVAGVPAFVEVGVAGLEEENRRAVERRARELARLPRIFSARNVY